MIISKSLRTLADKIYSKSRLAQPLIEIIVRFISIEDYRDGKALMFDTKDLEGLESKLRIGDIVKSGKTNAVVMDIRETEQWEKEPFRINAISFKLILHKEVFAKILANTDYGRDYYYDLVDSNKDFLMFIQIDTNGITDLIPKQTKEEDNTILVVGTKNAVAGYMMIGWSNQRLPEWGIEDFSDNLDNQSFYPITKAKKTNNAYIIRLLGNPPVIYDKPYVLYRWIAQKISGSQAQSGIYFTAIFEWASDEAIPYWVNLPMPGENLIDFEENEGEKNEGEEDEEESEEEGAFD